MTVIKLCIYCNQTLPISDFVPQNRRCIACRNEYARARWQKKATHADHRERDNERSRCRRSQIGAIIQKAKAEPCYDCGISYPFYVMDFDHKPEFTKAFNISKGWYAKRPLRVIEEEIAKCDLVCANCHRVRTYLRSRGINCTGIKNSA